QLSDAQASPDPRRLAAPLRRRQVIAEPGAPVLVGLVSRAGLGADLLPRVRGVMPLGDGDDPRQCRPTPPAASRPPGPLNPPRSFLMRRCAELNKTDKNVAGGSNGRSGRTPEEACERPTAWLPTVLRQNS